MTQQDTNTAQDLQRLLRERDAFATALQDSNEAFFKKVKEFSVIKRIGSSINATLDTREICLRIVDLIIDETLVENCSLWLINKAEQTLELTAVRGQSDTEARFIEADQRGEIRQPLGVGIAGKVAKLGEPIVLFDAGEGHDFVPGDASFTITSLMCLPIKSEGGVFGVLNLSHPDRGAFSREDQRLLELITDQISVSFKNMTLVEEIRALNRDLEAKVTQRTQHLRESEERYHRAITGGDVGIWDWELGARRLYVAPNLIEMLGYDPKTVSRRLRFWMHLMHPADRKDLEQNIREAMKQKSRLRQCELRMRHIDGNYRWFLVRGSVVGDKTGVPRRLSGSHSDIHRRKQAELELENLQREALVHAREAGKAEFATTVLHNIGNVLNSVNVDSSEIRKATRAMRMEQMMMAFQLINDNATDLVTFFNTEKGGQLQTWLSRIAEVFSGEASQLLALTEEIQNKIAIARDIIETQQSYAKGNELKKQNLVQLVDEALKIQHESIRKRGIMLQKKYAAVRPIELPSAKIIHLLINLVKNAVEAFDQAKQEGRVLSVELGERGREGVFLRVEDNGVGIAPENLEKMFTHGFTTKKTGHGFGLRWCAKTVDELGGQIQVSSDGIGKGAIFTIFIPYDPIDQEDTTTPSPRHDAAHTPGRDKSETDQLQGEPG